MSPTQRRLALGFIACMDARQYTELAELMAEDFTHRFSPASLNGMGMLYRNRQQFLEHLKELEPVFESLNFQPPKDIIEAQDVVVLHLCTDGRTATGKPYNNEYIFTFRFEGEKIASIKEFMDSQYVTHMLARETYAKL